MCDMCFTKEDLVQLDEHTAVCEECYRELSKVYFIDVDAE